MLAAKSPVFKTALWCHGGFVHLLYTVCDLEQLLAHGDYVNIHWPHYLETECLMWTSISRAGHIWQKQLIRTSLQFKSIIFQFGLQVKLQSLPETTRLQLNPPRGKRGAFKGSEQQNQPSQHMCAHTQASGCFEKCVCALMLKSKHTPTPFHPSSLREFSRATWALRKTLEEWFLPVCRERGVSACRHRITSVMKMQPLFQDPWNLFTIKSNKSNLKIKS